MVKASSKTRREAVQGEVVSSVVATVMIVNAKSVLWANTEWLQCKMEGGCVTLALLWCQVRNLAEFLPGWPVHDPGPGAKVKPLLVFRPRLYL